MIPRRHRCRHFSFRLSLAVDWSFCCRYPADTKESGSVGDTSSHTSPVRPSSVNCDAAQGLTSGVGGPPLFSALWGFMELVVVSSVKYLAMWVLGAVHTFRARTTQLAPSLRFLLVRLAVNAARNPLLLFSPQQYFPLVLW